MRTFLVLTALTAVASASTDKPRGSRGVVYNAIPTAGLGHGAVQYSYPQPSHNVYANPYAQVTLGPHYNGGGGHQHHAPVSHAYGGLGVLGGLGNGGLGTLGGLGGGGLGTLGGLGNGGLGTLGGFGGGGLGTLGVLGNGGLGGPSIAPLGLGYPEQISKSVYVFSAPPDPFDNIQPQVVKKFPVQKRKHYQVVFINAPNPPLPVQHTVELPSPPELKTQVYVLVKKPHKAPPLRVIPAKVPVHKPEVYFIRYQNQKGHYGGIPGGPGPILTENGGYGGGLVETGPIGYGTPVDAGPVSYGAPADVGQAGYGAPVHSSGGYAETEVVSGGYGAPAGDYGTPAAEYGSPTGSYESHGSPGSPTSEYGAPAADYGNPAADHGPPAAEYGTPTAEYGSPGPSGSQYAGGSAVPDGDAYSDYSRLNALYTYAPRYAKQRMMSRSMDTGRWRPMPTERDAGMSGI